MLYENCKTVLIAWELGQGYGHLTCLKPIVQNLSEHDLKIVMVVRDVVRAREVFLNQDVLIFQAPIFPESLNLHRNNSISNYADIITMFGFDEVESLLAMTQAWENIFLMVRPDLMIADHSPTACLAALGRIPVAIVGNGFTMPPVHLDEFPLLRSDLPVIVPQSKVLENIRAVQKKRNGYRPETITEIFRSELRTIFTYPGLDPYNFIRTESVHGPVGTMPSPSLITFDANMFVYCSAGYHGIKELCLGLAKIQMPVSVYMRGRATPLTSFLETKGINVYKKPPPLTDVIPKASVIVSHAGSGVSHAAFTAGRPQILFPRHLESSLTAQALKNHGVATVVPDITKNSLEWAVAHTCEDLKKRDLAYQCAMAVKKSPNTDIIPILVDTYLEILK